MQRQKLGPYQIKSNQIKQQELSCSIRQKFIHERKKRKAQTIFYGMLYLQIRKEDLEKSRRSIESIGNILNFLNSSNHD